MLGREQHGTAGPAPDAGADRGSDHHAQADAVADGIANAAADPDADGLTVVEAALRLELSRRLGGAR